MLKAPGTKRLKLDFDDPPSKSAFKFNSRRYNVVAVLRASMVGWCRLTLSNPP
jgi:hypothetical protein